jgi:molybdopterin synthase catalytic subunit
MPVRVQEADFDIGAEIDALTAGRTDIGAVATFTGLVRDFAENPGAPMTLEHYPGMTEKALEAIEAEARARWPLEGVSIIHRIGRLQPGARIVLVATASRHRSAAFDSAAFLMDYLKTKAPFWKHESGAGWVDARESDDAAAARWAAAD